MQTVETFVQPSAGWTIEESLTAASNYPSNALWPWPLPMPMHQYILSACLEPLAPVNEQQI